MIGIWGGSPNRLFCFDIATIPFNSTTKGFHTEAGGLCYEKLREWCKGKVKKEIKAL
ncbi:MAG: hypothetical protein GXP33_11605 [Spirochaetes bacterium]|nr:hypothetical protein [Spirochaetota bacterium]